MKPATTIIAGCLWLGLVVLLSIYGADTFSNLADGAKRKIIRTELSPPVDFAITIIPWNVFVSLLLCVPLLFIRKRRANATAKIGDAIVFFILLLGWNVMGIALLWILFPDSIGSYSGGPTVSGIEPYAIKEGWSPFKLWCAWWGFIVLSNAISTVMVFSIRQSRKSNPARSVLWS